MHHTQRNKERLQALIDHFREDVQKIKEPKAQALFERSSEVLEGLKTSFNHYEQQTEAARR
jgi:hypothetical protein